MAPKFAGQILLKARDYWKQLESARMFEQLLKSFDGALLSPEGREVVHCQIPIGQLERNTVLFALQEISEELTAKLNGQITRSFWADFNGWSDGAQSLNVSGNVRTPESIAHQHLLKRVVVAAQSLGWIPSLTAGIGRPDLVLRAKDWKAAIVIEIKTSESLGASRDQLRLGIGQLSGYLGKARMSRTNVAWAGLVVIDQTIDWSAENKAIAASFIRCCDFDGLGAAINAVSEDAIASKGLSQPS